MEFLVGEATLLYPPSPSCSRGLSAGKSHTYVGDILFEKLALLPIFCSSLLTLLRDEPLGYDDDGGGMRPL